MLVGDNDLYRTSTSELDTEWGPQWSRTMNAKPPHPLTCALVRVIRERKAPASPHGLIERHDDDVLATVDTAPLRIYKCVMPFFSHSHR
jgi:hypothetical protein